MNLVQSNLGRVHRHPSWLRMHSSAVCASCAVSTADESSHLAMGTLHPYHSATFFLYIRPTLQCLIPPHKNKFAPFRWRIPTPPLKSRPPAHLTHRPKWHNCSTCCCNYFCRINSPNCCMVTSVLGHDSPLTHWSLSLTFTQNLTLTLLTLLSY